MKIKPSAQKQTPNRSYARKFCDGIVDFMKRYIPLLLLLVLLTGCATTQGQQEDRTEQVRSALLEVLMIASESIEANLHADFQLSQLLPPDSVDLLQQTQIPRLQEHLEIWKQQVLLSFRKATLELPELLVPYINNLTIEDPIAIMKESNSSASDLLVERYGQEIYEEIQNLLSLHLTESMQTWDFIRDRYSIWVEGMVLLGKPRLSDIDENPSFHLSLLFAQTFAEQLTKEEIYLRTTPDFQGTGSLYETLQQDTPL